MQIRFWVGGEPKGQPRPSPGGRPPRFPGDKPKRWTYNPKVADAWKACVKLYAERHRPETPINEAVAVDIYWFFERPKRLMRRNSPDGPVPYIAKPDRDNLDKSTLDALDDAGWFSDDSRVCAGRIVKCYAPKGREPGAVIVIRDASPDVLAARDALMEVSDGRA